MSSITYYRVTGIVFGIVALVHLLRVFMGWSIQFGSFVLPIWASIISIFIAAYLSYLGCIKYGKLV